MDTYQTCGGQWLTILVLKTTAILVRFVFKWNTPARVPTCPLVLWCTNVTTDCRVFVLETKPASFLIDSIIRLKGKDRWDHSLNVWLLSLEFCNGVYCWCNCIHWSLPPENASAKITKSFFWFWCFQFMCLLGLASLSEVIIFCIGFVKLLKKHPRETEPELDLEMGAGALKKFRHFFCMVLLKRISGKLKWFFSPGPFGTP